MQRLVVFFSGVAAVAGLHIDQQQHAASHVAAKKSTKKAVASTSHKKVAPHLRHTVNLANAYSALSRKKQEPAAEEAAPAEGAEEPPAGDLPIDEEGYNADWGTEHRSEAYPPESIGKQHNPSYDQTAARIKAELSGSWWWWVLGALLILAIAAGVYKYTQK